MTKIKVVTHSGGFHADDAFGVATLMLLLGKENIELTRSREPEIIESGEYVLDVGNIYDPNINRFDHHQEGGAGQRENGIPYAAFGLIWKKFGVEVAGSEEAALLIDRELVQAIDANDNGTPLYTSLGETRPFLVQSAISLFAPAWGEPLSHDEGFQHAVEFAYNLLKREILHAQGDVGANKVIHESYAQTEDKRLIVVESNPVIARTSISYVLSEYPEPLYFVRQHEDTTWQLGCVTVRGNLLFQNRKDLPKAWAGKRGAELAEITGVPDALFCHNKCFMAIAKTKEGALALASLALEA